MHSLVLLTKVECMLENTLDKAFKLSGFRIGQKEIINSILEKKDALAVLPTGGGKSLCYQFPAVYLQQLVVVISPLIALMKDQVSSLQAQGIPAGCLHSGQTEEAKRQIKNNNHQNHATRDPSISNWQMPGIQQLCGPP